MSSRTISRSGSLIVAVWVTIGLSGCHCLSRDVLVCGNACAPHVEILRGSVGIFPGAEDFQETLANRGIASTITCCELWRQVADRLIQERTAGCCQPVVLIGYSRGAEAAINVASRLQQEGIAVDAIIILEGNHHRRIPGNVCYCFNAYKLTCVPCLHGLPVEAECGSTMLVNYDLVENDPSGHMQSKHHLSLPCDPCVHALLGDQIAMVLSAPTCQAEEQLPAAEIDLDGPGPTGR